MHDAESRNRSEAELFELVAVERGDVRRRMRLAARQERRLPIDLVEQRVERLVEQRSDLLDRGA